MTPDWDFLNIWNDCGRGIEPLDSQSVRKKAGAGICTMVFDYNSPNQASICQYFHQLVKFDDYLQFVLYGEFN